MSKAEQLRRAKQILNDCKIGETINSEDYFFMMDVFKNHHDWDQKMGTGVKDITVELVGSYKSRSFILIRDDNTRTDISYTKALSTPTMDSELKCACRNAISEEIKRFRDENVVFGITRCAITGAILTKENTHIDHYNLTFAQLYKNWIETQNRQYLISKLNKATDNDTVTRFTDESISRSFRIYHNLNTNLRAVTKDINQKLSLMTNAEKQQKLIDWVRAKNKKATPQKHDFQEFWVEIEPYFIQCDGDDKLKMEIMAEAYNYR